MKRLPLLLVAFSFGLNAGLVYYFVSERRARDEKPAPSPAPRERPAEPRDAETAIREHLDLMTRDLELSPSQVTALHDLLSTQMPQMTILLRRTTEANRRISEAYGEPAFDEVRFREMVRLASESRTRADSLSAVMLLAEAEILTPAQREKFAHTAPSVYSNARRDQPQRDRDRPAPQPGEDRPRERPADRQGPPQGEQR